MITGRRSRTRRARGQHVDTEAERHTGLSFVLLVAPLVAVVVVLALTDSEDVSRVQPAWWAVAALALAAALGGEWLVVRLTRRRREEE